MQCSSEVYAGLIGILLPEEPFFWSHDPYPIILISFTVTCLGYSAHAYQHPRVAKYYS